MVKDAAQQYANLRQQLLLGRAHGSLTEAEEDRLLEQMDAVWWAMTDAEHLDAERTLASARRTVEITEEIARREVVVNPVEKLASFQMTSKPRTRPNLLSQTDADIFRASRSAPHP